MTFLFTQFNRHFTHFFLQDHRRNTDFVVYNSSSIVNISHTKPCSKQTNKQTTHYSSFNSIIIHKTHHKGFSDLAKMKVFEKFKIWVLLICLISQLGYGYYLPGSYPHKYVVGDTLSVKVNSLTSIETEIPYSYYSLPLCKPQEGVKDSAENLGELLMGDRIENSPYKFKMHTNETEIFLCQTKPLSSDEFKLLTSRIDEMYQVNVILDNLPAIRYTKKDNFLVRWTGYPLGVKIQDTYYVFNHLKFTVLVHKYEETNVASVMGAGDAAETIPTVDKPGADIPAQCRVVKGFKDVREVPVENLVRNQHRNNGYKENQPVAFTYEVEFVESDIKWPSRWDAYLKMEGAKVHWFSILNSLMVITFLAGIVLVIFLRTVRRDLTHYEELDKEAQAQMNEELSGWKLVVSDVFRVPDHPALLCVMVGDGVQILGMAVVTILFAALGFMSPASRGTLLTGMLFFYMILGVAAGYVAVRMWRTIFIGDHKGWVSVCWKVACFFPGIAFLILFVLNFLLWGSHSTGAIPFSLFVILILLWFCISVPLTLVGGYFGAKAPHIEYPVRTNQIPREIPPQKYPSWLLVLGAGTLPFGTLFIELFFIMSSIWMGRVYYVFGFLFIVLILLVVVCAEVSLVLTYMHLCVEDYKWWWKSFFASGSVALYIFLYSINYLVFDLKSLSGPVSATLYLGYSLFMVLAIMLATGTVGFLSSFWFVHYLFSSVKLD
ncbi:putative nonaspanin (TM9SF) [Helianthus annuus]|nr:putative nonaspanin (TM9SF) [Helianthus annuus]